MNVVVVCDAGTIDGGASKVAITTALALKSKVDRVAFVAGMGMDESLAPTGIETHDLQQRWVLKSESIRKKLRYLASNPVVATRFAEILRGFDPLDTVVHIHLCLDRLSSAVIRVASDLGFPVVFTCHDYAFACPTGLLYDHRRQAICHLNPLSPACLTRNCTTTSYVSKATLYARSWIPNVIGGMHERISRFIFPSQIAKSILEPHLHSGDRGEVLYYPIDVQRRPRVVAAENGPLLWLGRLVPEKDPVLMARAARAAGTKIVFVGDGPLRSEVEKSCPDAEVTGWVDPTEVRARIEKGRALVMTSRWYEVAPLVTTEALGAGLPVVVPDTCATREFVVDGETGFVFKGGDDQDLARTFRLLADKATVDRMGSAAYDRYWADPLTMERHFKRLLPLYEETLSDATGPSRRRKAARA